MALPAYLDGLRMLGRRELSVAQVRARLLEREHPAAEVEAAITSLIETRALDDRRVAKAFAATATRVKGRGRLRVTRELQAMGISRDIIAEAVGEVFGDQDERTLITQAIRKKLHGRPRPVDAAGNARLFQYLMRQGFSPAAISQVLRARERPDEF